VGSLKYLGEAGVQSITYYETTGWRGVMEQEAGSPLPERFRSLPGGVFPLYHVLADAGDFRGGEVLRTHASTPLAVDGLAFRRGNRLRVLIANLSPTAQEVTLIGCEGPARVRILDETNAEAAMGEPEAFRSEIGEGVEFRQDEFPLNLEPYAVARVDLKV
jgi:hypothetical protein